MNDFYMKVYSVVCAIPKGKVATYGQIAKMLGSVTYSRSVGNALHNNPDPDKIPCHRVVSSSGKLAASYDYSCKMYKEGKTEVKWYQSSSENGSFEPVATAEAAVPGLLARAGCRGAWC